MRSLLRHLTIVMTATGTILAAAAFAKAETATLELKRLAGEGHFLSGSDNIYRATYPQSFFIQMDKNMKPTGGNTEQLATFKRIVKKEPKYQSDNPFRGVAKLGSREFAFALDAPAPAAKGEKPNGEKAKTKDKEPKAESGIATLANLLFGTVAPAETSSPSAIRYNRLYFDFNRNGDLTDDKAVDAIGQDSSMALGDGQSYLQFRFPRIDVATDVEGTKLDCSFLLAGYTMASSDYSQTSISLSAAAYREGDITLDGKKRHVVLIDFNSNGRFDDEIRIRKEIRTPDGSLYPEQGDMLLVDANSNNMGSPYDVTSGDDRHYVGKLVNIDGRYYDMKVSPAGDKLTLTASSVPLGNVTNPNDSFVAVIYGDKGFLKIAGNKGKPAPVPEGEWKLLFYTITKAPKVEKEEPIKPAEKKPKNDGETVVGALAKTLAEILGGSALPEIHQARHEPSAVSAQGTADYKAVKVVKGETVEFPFGPPYKPVVRVDFVQRNGDDMQLSLGMSLVGSAGESCINMTVAGGRPSKPAFTITDSKGKVVQEGSFEYG